MIERKRIRPRTEQETSDQKGGIAQKKGPTGYKKPPEEYRFKPGESGNPGGRPKKLSNPKDDWRDALSEPTIVGKKKTTKLRAIVDGLVDNAPANPRVGMAVMAYAQKLFEDDNQYDSQVHVKSSDPLGAKLDALRTVLAAILKDHKQNADLASVAELVAFCFAVRDASGALVPAIPNVAGMAERMKTYEPYFQKEAGEDPSNAKKDEDNK